jgi:formate hydrogenlyase subunit 4
MYPKFINIKHSEPGLAHFKKYINLVSVYKSTTYVYVNRGISHLAKGSFYGNIGKWREEGH